MAKYTKQQWITAEETYKNTGSYLQARFKSGIPVNNIKVKSVRRSWKREKDSNVYRMYTEIVEEIQQETKQEIKSVLTKIRETQELIQNELSLCKTISQKVPLFHIYIKTLSIEGKITGELNNRYPAQTVGKPILGGASIRTVKELRKNKTNII